MLLQKVAGLEEQISALQEQLSLKHANTSAVLPMAAKAKPALAAASSSQAEEHDAELSLADQEPLSWEDDGGRPDIIWQSLVLEDIQRLAETDPAQAATILQHLVEKNPDSRESPLVAHGIYELSKDETNLPDYQLESIYDNQKDRNVQRVSAQVLAQRGDSRLLERYIAESANQLSNENPAERSASLYSLSKTGSKLAANAIVPLLDDQEASIRMDALAALNATGNQSHLDQVTRLLNDPDENVRTLAGNVIENLTNLSENARSTISDEAIAQNLMNNMDLGLGSGH